MRTTVCGGRARGAVEKVPVHGERREAGFGQGSVALGSPELYKWPLRGNSLQPSLHYLAVSLIRLTTTARR